MDMFFTSDHHFGHDAVIEMCNRPWKTGNQMDKALVKLHNEIVKPEDEVYFIGDLSMKAPMHKGHIEQCVSKMNGRKILILGNHDRLKPFDYIEMGFESVHTSLILDLDMVGIKLILNHDPAAGVLLDYKKDFLIHGHLHNTHVIDINCINVSVDVWNYKPVNVWEIIGLIEGGVNRNEQDVRTSD